jgi:hypothetical protein
MASAQRISDLNQMLNWLKTRKEHGHLLTKDSKVVADVYDYITQSNQTTHRRSVDSAKLLQLEKEISALFNAYVTYDRLQALGIPTEDFKRHETLIPHAERMKAIISEREASAKFSSINRALATVNMNMRSLPTAVPTAVHEPKPQQKLNAIAAYGAKNPWFQSLLPPRFFWDSKNRQPTNHFKFDEVDKYYAMLPLSAKIHRGGKTRRRRNASRQTRYRGRF